MTKAEKRVAVAKDVLKQIKAGVVRAARMVYFQPVKTTKAWVPGADAQTAILNGALKKCDTCALGAALVSYVRLYDGVMIGENGTIGRAKNVLGPLFGIEHLRRIERAFEGWDIDDESQRPVWMKKYPGQKGRLIAIMRNIVRNKGTFKPSARA